jgi:uroporphyrinogen-III decarboxylase
MAGDPRYIFNLGHGVPKETHPQVLKELVGDVPEWGRLGEGSR